MIPVVTAPSLALPLKGEGTDRVDSNQTESPLPSWGRVREGAGVCSEDVLGRKF
jgi:hypothetical protein